MPEFNNKEIEDAIKAGAFFVIVALICVFSLVAYSIIRDQRFLKPAKQETKHTLNRTEPSPDRVS